MKRILTGCLLVSVPVTILLIVAGLWLARQHRLSPFLLNTRDRYTTQAEIDLWDVQSHRQMPVVRYDQNFVGKTAGWSWPVFSADGRWVAYVRRERSKQWIGVSDSTRWQPVEFLATVPPMAQNTRLTWLPSSRGLLVSYTVDNHNADFETLVGRQLLDLNAAPDKLALVDWPFVCDRLLLGDPSGGLLLRCAFQRDLSLSDAPFPDAMVYPLASGQWLTASAAVSTRELFPLDDLLHPNWAYSAQSGVAFFGTFFDGAPGGLNRVALGSDQAVRLPVELTRRPQLLWSPDGSRLLIEQANSRVWSVFDLAQNRAIARLGDADIDVNIGYGWYHDANHVAYVVLPSSQQSETLHVRALDHDEDLILPTTSRMTDVVWMHP